MPPFSNLNYAYNEVSANIKISPAICKLRALYADERYGPNVHGLNVSIVVMYKLIPRPSY
jgi:hypothetical protein